MSSIIKSGITKDGREWDEWEWERYMNEGITPDDPETIPVDYVSLAKRVIGELKLAKDKVSGLVANMDFDAVTLREKLKELFGIGR
jgi:hypothetical protein